MNRRNFLEWLGLGTVIGATAAMLPIEQVLAFNPHRVFFDMSKNLPILPTYSYVNSYGDVVPAHVFARCKAILRANDIFPNNEGYYYGIDYTTR